MKAPFKLPARWEGGVSSRNPPLLVAADCELIAEAYSTNAAERDYLLAAINQRDWLLQAVKDLLACAELNYDDPWEPATEATVKDVSAYLAEIGEW